MIGTAALDGAIGRRRLATRLRPFLELCLGVAQRPARRVKAWPEGAFDYFASRRQPAVEIGGANDGFADVGEDRRIAAYARRRFAAADPEIGSDAPLRR